jgi:hypothetical protein
MSEPLCGILPAGKLVAPTALSRLRAPRPVLAPAFAAALIEQNPWLRALRGLGHDLAVEPRMIPIEEGETSLNANSHQALACLLPLLLGREQGLRLTVIGTMAGGNHGLDFALTALSRSFADAGRARAALSEALGDAALASAGALLAGCRPNVRKAFFRLPAALQRARALRLPAARIAAPDADRLAGLGAALGLDPWLCERLAAVREAMAGAGLETAADLFLLLRSALLHRLGAMLGASGLAHVPASLEYLIVRGTDAALPQCSLRELAAHWLAAFALATRGRERRIDRFGGARFRVLNYYDPVALLLRGGGRDGRGGRSRAGWRSLSASFATGVVVARDRQSAELAGLPLAELLSRGYGLSGKLTYLAVRAVNGGAVCNQIFPSPAADVFAALADPHHPGLVLPLRWIDVHGGWQAAPGGRRPELDLLVLAQWLERSTDPPRTLARIFGVLRDLWCDTRAPRAALVLDERPGVFQLR